MLDGLDILDEIAGMAAEVSEAIDDCLLYRLEWTPPQLAWLSDPSPEKLLRTGNQIGKTTVGLAEVIYRCRGTHPHFATTPPPIEAWIICASWTQSVGIQEKLWALLPPEVKAINQWDKAQGFSPIKSPVVRFPEGSLIRIKTTQQDTLDLAGATIDLVLIDELTKKEIYEELQRRVLRRGGAVLQTLTPINAPAEWLRELTEAIGPDGLPLIVDHHYRMEAANFVPVGSTVPLYIDDKIRGRIPMDAKWIAEQRGKMPDLTMQAIRLDGEWQTNHSARELKGFSDAVLFGDDDIPGLPSMVEFGLGMDHGEGVGREWAGLVGWDGWCLWVLAEYTNEGTTGPEQDAAGIEAMMRPFGVRLEHINRAIGDINSAGYNGGGLSVNETLQVQFDARCGGRAPFRIEGANKARGTVKARVWMLNNALLSGRIRVHKGCARLVQAMRQWKGKENDSAQLNGQRVHLKDPLDGLGYVAVEYLGDLAQPQKLQVVGGDGRGGRR